MKKPSYRKLKQMLAKPHFLSVQRFFRAGGEGRNYLAFWVLSSPEAFNTVEYKSDWGFFEWRPYIIDWSRDLFERADGGSGAPVVQQLRHSQHYRQQRHSGQPQIPPTPAVVLLATRCRWQHVDPQWLPI